MALLRAAVWVEDEAPGWWPDPDDPRECRIWLEEVWHRPAFAEAIEQASPTLAGRATAVRDGAAADPRRIRRAVMSTARYLLRATGRPTPFGLFAGVVSVNLGGETRARWGPDHRPFARSDTQWLAAVVDELESCPELLDRLDVVANTLIARRGNRLEIPRGGGWVSVAATPAVDTALALASGRARLSVLADLLAAAVGGGDVAAARTMLTGLVRHGILISELRAPFTCTDPLGYVLDRLDAVGAADLPAVAAPAAELAAIRVDLVRHSRVSAADRRPGRVAVTARMRRLSPAGRTPLAVDLRLDGDVQLPAAVADELEHAAAALLRLTRHPAGLPAWVAYHAAFRDRYGVGTLVPLAEALDPDTGLGYPAGYPGSTLPPPPDAPDGHDHGHGDGRDDGAVQRRDATLLARAWQAVRDGGEVVLSDADIHDLAGGRTELDERWIPPHVELAARICATDPRAIDRGDYTLLVAPARAGGTLTSRFTTTTTGDGLHRVYRELPVSAAGALPVQLTFPPAYPHAENICRIPEYLPHVLSLGEHRPSTEKADAGTTVLTTEHLALTATADRLHLVHLADGRVVEPQVFHALALDKQAPPLARFLAHLPRALGPTWTVFDWGPHADALPHLPAVRYRRSILAAARWRLAVADLPAPAASDRTTSTRDDSADPTPGWPQALERWRRQWGCPASVELREEDRSLLLRLDEPMHIALLRAHLDRHGHAVLTDPVASTGAGWIGGHAHEVVMPLARRRPAPPPATAGPQPRPVLTNRSHRPSPGGAGAQWLTAKLAAHPDRQDQILGTHLPDLLDELGAAGACWFVRYRSHQEIAHLRLRFRLPDPDRFGSYAAVVARWADRLRADGLANGLSFDSYQPEIGRYGTGAALIAAEEVFVADSHAVITDLGGLPPAAVHPTALTAIGMVHLTCGLLGRPRGLQWLARRPARSPTAPAADPAVTAQAVRAVRSGLRPELLGRPAQVGAAWRARTDALAAYAEHLNSQPDAATDAVLESLLHMHHNRAAGIDPDHERRCRRLARQAAVAARAWPGPDADGTNRR